MSTIDAPTTSRTRPDPDPTTSASDADQPAGLGAVIRSETTKFRSVRSTWWTLVATVGLMIGLGSLLCFAYVSRFDRLPPGERFGFDATSHSLRGIFLAQLAIGVLGVLVISGEYATGLIRNTIAAVPRRGHVLIAKAVVFGLVALVVCTAASVVTFFLGQSILSSKHVGVGLGDPGALRAVIGAGVYLTGVGLLGLGLGALLRRTAGAVATLFGLVLVLPILAEALPSPWNADVSKYLPGTIGEAAVSVHPHADTLNPVAGLVLLFGYVALVGAAAIVSIRRRDV